MFSTCPSIADPLLQENPAFEVPFDPNFPFGSEAANLEYSILSAILGNPSPPQGESTPPPSYSGWPSSDPLSLASQSPTFSSAFPASMTSSQTNLAASPNTTYLAYQYQESSRSSELSEMQYPQYTQSQNLQPRYPDSRSKSPPLSVFIDESSHGLLSPPHSNASPSLTPTAPRPADPTTLACTSGSKLQSINDRVTKPYDYTEGYHFLMKHLPIRCVFLIELSRRARVSSIGDSGPFTLTLSAFHIVSTPEPTHFLYISLFRDPALLKVWEKWYSTYRAGISHLPAFAHCTTNASVFRRRGIRGKVFPKIVASTWFCTTLIFNSELLHRCLGTRETDIFQRNTDCSLASYGRDMPCRTRVLHAYGMVNGRAAGTEKVYLWGEVFSLFSVDVWS